MAGVGSFVCAESLFFSAVFRKARVVIRSLLLGLQSSTETGVCSQTGQVVGKVDVPALVVSDAQQAETTATTRSLTVFAQHLLAAGCFERVDCQLAADGAAKLERDFLLRQ